MFFYIGGGVIRFFGGALVFRRRSRFSAQNWLLPCSVYTKLHPSAFGSHKQILDPLNVDVDQAKLTRSRDTTE